MRQKLDTFISGVILGIIIPAVLYYFFVLPTMQHYRFMGNLYSQIIIKMLPVFLSRCIFPNALLFFFLLYWLNMEKMAKGVLFSTAVTTAILLVINFLL